MSIYNDVDSRVSAYKGNPQALMQRYSMSQDLLDAIALSKIKTMKKAAQNEAIAEMAKHQGDDTVYGALEKELLEGAKEEVNPTKDTAQQATGAAQQQQRQQQAKLKQVLQGEQPDPRMSGIALAPGAQGGRYVGGGIVAFSGGGPTAEAWERFAREMERSGLSNNQYSQYDRPAYERRQVGPPRSAASGAGAFEGPPRSAMLTPQQLQQLASKGSEGAALAAEAARNGGRLALSSVARAFGAVGAATTLAELGIDYFQRGMEADTGEHAYGLGSELSHMVGAVAPDVPAESRRPNLPRNEYFPEPVRRSDTPQRVDESATSADTPTPTSTQAGDRPPPPPPPPPRDDQQQQQPQPASAPAAPQRTGIGYLEQVMRDRSGVPTGLEAAYRQQAESAIKADPEKIAEAERTRALAYLEGPNAEADRKARADEIARRRAVAEQSQAGAARRELIAGLIGAGGRTSNLGALMAGGAGAVNAAMRNEAAQEQALRDIFGMEETDRLRGLEMRKGAYGAGQAAQTESTRARTSAVSSVGNFLTQSEQNQLMQIKGMAEAIDRENARILEEAKYKQRAGEIKDAKTFEAYQAAEKEYNRVVMKWEELKKGQEYTKAASLLQTLGRADKQGESDMVRQQRQTAANTVLTFEKNAADARAAAHNQVKLAAQRAGIPLGSVSSRSDGVEEEMRRRGLLGGR